MKYLKKYKLFESFNESDVKDVFEPHIDWNLIENVKDMSIEYIDEGFTLSINIEYKIDYYPTTSGDKYPSSIITVYHVEYNHKSDFRVWTHVDFNQFTEGPYEFEPIDKNKIWYQFGLIYLTDDNISQQYLSNSDDRYDHRYELSNDFYTRLQQAYPNRLVEKYGPYLWIK